MPTERWLPLKFELPDGLRVGRLAYAASDWQIFRVDRTTKVLVAKDALARRWLSSGLLSESTLTPLTLGEQEFMYLTSGQGLELAPVNEWVAPESKTDALAFAVSLSETRKIEKEAPLQDAVYVERYARLLPAWTVTSQEDDAQVLGAWLTGGVRVAATSLRRLSKLMGWLDKGDVREVVETAGFELPQEQGDVLAKGRRARRDGSAVETTELGVHPIDQARVGETGQEIESAQFRLPGRPQLEAFFNEHVIDILANAVKYKKLGIDFPTAIMLHGPPGCGKTFAVERLVKFLDWPIYSIDSSSVGSPYIHETSRKISEVFDKAVESAPSVIVIDEMESFLSDRQIHQSTGLHHLEEVAEFLRRIPEATARHVLVIGMTNRIEMIDSAILRRGRFDHVIGVDMPSREEVVELLTSLLGRVPLDVDVKTRDAVDALTGRPMSDAAFAVREAARLAARSGRSAVGQEHLEAAVANLPSVKQGTTGLPIGFIWED